MKVPEGYCFLGRDGTILRATAQFLVMIGADRPAAGERRRFGDLFELEAERRRFAVLCLEAWRTGRVENITCELKRADGAAVPVNIDLEARAGSLGPAARLKVRIEDMTYVRDLERGLVRSRDAYFNMLKDLHASLTEVRELLNEFLLAFANALDAKSHWTMGHSERVAGYCVGIAREMGLDGTQVETLRVAALLHDIGKIGTFDEVLDKPGKLTPWEYELVKKHPDKGGTILGPIRKMKGVLPIIIHHHEKMNGMGYPDGLKAGEIPLLARILAVADSYDSMIADRPYRPSLGRDRAIAELKGQAGTQFDPDVVQAFLHLLEETAADENVGPGGKNRALTGPKLAG
ncbi:MAG TPA: HD domain-containing phosphohydrolase [Candidatus Methanoperedens sp.]|nr:HD domain-containing phosphohydrolase [Candidatus Methanoperedens sp.]